MSDASNFTSSVDPTTSHPLESSPANSRMTLDPTVTDYLDNTIKSVLDFQLSDASTSQYSLLGTQSGKVNSNQRDTNTESEKYCWICLGTQKDKPLATWVQPCKCCGTSKWVHHDCLNQWVDEEQKGNALKSVKCRQCHTEYIIVFPRIGKFAKSLETIDNFIKRMSPFLAAGIFVGSLYWTAATYGAVTFLQVVGHKKGLSVIEDGDPLLLLFGLPAIPVGLILGRMIPWEDAVLRLIRNRHNVARKFPLMGFIMPYRDENEEQSHQNHTIALSDRVSVPRIFCGALLLPSISVIVGRILFGSFGNTLHRTLLGGFTYITIKGILKIYLKQKQYSRKEKRRIVDYTEANLIEYFNRIPRHTAPTQSNAAAVFQNQNASQHQRQSQHMESSFAFNNQNSVV